MIYVYLVAFASGLLLAVRLMFFGAERRRQRRPDGLPVRWSEPAGVAFLIMFGVVGYLLTRHALLDAAASAATAGVLALVWAAIIARFAVWIARRPVEQESDDPRFALQGRVGTVTAAIPAAGTGEIRFLDGGVERVSAARTVDGATAAEGTEVCIDRVDDGVAVVELWSSVETRL